MALDEHVRRLRAGAAAWNAWRFQHQDLKPDLSHLNWLNEAPLGEAVLAGANLTGAFLAGAKMPHVFMPGVHLIGANLMHADLTSARFGGSDLSCANLLGADLTDANFQQSRLFCANFAKANLTRAKLQGSDLSGAVLVEADLSGANISGCRVYGVSAWDVKVDAGTDESDLLITQATEPDIRVDRLEMAQFLNLLRANTNIKQAFDTISAKVVLILGRFSGDCKPVLDKLRRELQKRDYVPILFDGEKPGARSLSETVRTLGHLARFIIADLTDPHSVPYELGIMTSLLTSVPLQPIILASQEPFAMFPDLQLHGCVLDLFRYKNAKHLMESLSDKVIEPCEQKRLALRH